MNDTDHDEQAQGAEARGETRNEENGQRDFRHCIEVRENIRRQLAEEKQARALLDELRKQTYVSLRL